MFFKTALIALMLIATIGCGLKIGEEAPKDDPIVIGGVGFSCMSELSEKVDEFLGARMKDDAIRKFMSCIRYGFESFGRRTRGREANSFSPIEIRDFLTEYFLKNRRISDTLLRDMMVVKKTLLGGPIDKITRGDLVHAIETLKFFEEQALRLNPYMDLYNFQVGRIWVQQADNPSTRVDEAIAVLREVSNAVGHRLAQAAHTYPIKNLESLLAEFREFAGWEEIFTNARPPESWGKFLSAYKAIVTGDDSAFVRPQDWSVLLSSSAGIYGLHIKTKYARSKTSLLHGEGLEALIRTGDDLVAIANAAIDRQPRKLISFEVIDRLIDSLPAVGLMPEVATADANQPPRPFRPTSLKMAVRALFDRILGDDSVPWRSRRSEGLSRINIGQMVAEFSLWTEIQRFLDRTFSPGENSGGRPATLAEKLGPLGASDSLMRLMGTKDVSSEGMQVVRAIEMQLRPLYRPGEYQVFLTEQSELPKHQVVHGFHNLSIMNIIRGAIALLMRGYSSFKSAEGFFNKGMTEDEMQTFYMDIRDLGVDLSFFDPRSETSGTRAFREANLFTYSGNGIMDPEDVPEILADHLTPAEAMEYLAMVYSGGNMGKEIYQAMLGSERALCAEASRGAPISRHGYPMIDRTCFGQHLMSVLLPRLKTMPTMFTELSRANPERRVQVARDLIDTVAGTAASTPNFIEWHEITTLAMILHYTESVMTRYNRDGDNFLNTEEVWSAYATFANYMSLLIRDKCRAKVADWADPRNASQLVVEIMPWLEGWSATKNLAGKAVSHLTCDHLPEELSASVFAYLISNGKVPANTSDLVFGLRRYVRAPIIGVKFNVDRSRLLKVFAALVKESAESSTKK